MTAPMNCHRVFGPRESVGRRSDPWTLPELDRQRTTVPKVLEIPDEKAIGVVHEFDDRNGVLCRIDQTDTLRHRLSRNAGIRPVEALVEFTLQAISGNERVQDGFEVEDGACDGFHLVEGVLVIWGHVDVGTAPDIGFYNVCSLYDELTEVVAGLKIKDGGNEFERVLIRTSQIGRQDVPRKHWKGF